MRSYSISWKYSKLEMNFCDYQLFRFDLFFILLFLQLQQHFNEVIFNLEREMYLAEGVRMSEISFEDNSECVLLIEGRTGLIGLLEDECAVGSNGSDMLYINKVHFETRMVSLVIYEINVSINY